MAAIIKIAILAEARKAISSIKDVAKTSETAGKKIKRSLSIAGGIGAGVSVAGLGVALKDGVNEAIKFQDAANLVNDALATNSKLSGTNVKQVQAAAAALEDLTGAKIDENDATVAANKIIRAGVTSQADLNRALKVSAGIALATGKGMDSVSTAVSKALANPAKAAGILNRAGVVLTDTQQSALKAMLKTGNAAGAQGVILSALETKYNATADAAGKGLAADLGRAQDAFDDSKRSIAQGLMPTISRLAGIFTKLVPVISHPAFLALVGIIGALVVAMKIWTAVQWALNIAMSANPLGLIILAIAAVIAIIVLIATKTTWFQTIWRVAWSGIKAAALAVWNWLKSAFNWIVGILVAFNTRVRAIIGAVTGWIRTQFSNFIRGIKVIWSKILDVVRTVEDFRRKVIAKAKAVLDYFLALPGKLIDGVVNGLKAGWHKITDFIRSGLDLIPEGVRNILGIHSPSRVMAGFGENIAEGLAEGIKRRKAAAVNAMRKVTEAVRKTAGAKSKADIAAPAIGGHVEIEGSARAGAGGGATYNVTVQVPPTVDAAEVGRQIILAIEARERLTGRKRLASA